MRLKNLRSYQAFRRRTKGLFYRNPVLSCGLALPFAASSATLSTGVAISWAMLLVYLPMMVLAAVWGSKLPLWKQAIIYPLAGSLLLIPARFAVRVVSPTIFSSLGVYFALLCVSAMLAVGVRRSNLHTSPTRAAKEALLEVAGFAAVVIPLSALREMLGSGTLWNIPLPFIAFRFSGLSAVFGGFILLGFAMAFFRLLHRGIQHLMIRSAAPRPEEGLPH